MKFTPTKDQQENRKSSARSPLSPIVISPNCSIRGSTTTASPSSRFSKTFSTPQPAKITKFSPKSANKASTQKKKRLNFNSPSVKKLLDKIAKKSVEGGETSNLKRLKRLIFRKKAVQENKENFENTEYTFTECSDDGSFYFGTEKSSEGEMSEEELDFAFGLDHQDFGMMSPKRPSVLSSASRSSINPAEKRGFSLQHLFKKREEIKKAEEIIEKFDISKQLEDLSVADTILGQWANLNK
ncbi:predicted protein [Naegleria gruberi]|uniref:Predicted protein n=1 Tax=Naegleria gruberi TaxID=5762 RepID=D2VDY0_NAEGR|nr:uncharacterized protein NAEGRDRAFT_48764 [Naegleria gruberi]EFC45076.1 predicted protein [Naegleria gruberi]|eukprot:XP_002677820.1 predicted protein [Naegleria gruberi strain NEG-M]